MPDVTEEWVGGREIVASRTVVLIGEEGYEIADPSVGRIEFEFAKAEGDPVVAVRAKEGGAIIRLTNFYHALPTAWSSRIGTVRDTPITLAMTVSTIAEADGRVVFRLLNFTLSMGASK